MALLLIFRSVKLEKNLGSISDLTRLPAALFIVDITKEYIAVREAKRLGIPVFAMVDTNSDPTTVDFPIPANDDASKSIQLIIDLICKAIEEGLGERKIEKEKDADTKDKTPKREVKSAAKRVRTVKAEEVGEEEEEVKDIAVEKDEIEEESVSE